MRDGRTDGRKKASIDDVTTRVSVRVASNPKRRRQCDARKH